MNSLDKNYLSLQFRDKVHQKNAMEFQSFFESVMEKAYSTFKKVRPYGSKGDSGNDGYIPDEGIYYQVYAPGKPQEKDAEAAKKFKSDFEKLKQTWEEIKQIRILNFVFNDKYAGSSIELEKAKAELERANQNIKFEIFLPKDLERIFFTLTSDQIASLGFDVDSRNSLKNVRELLGNLEEELNKGNAGFVLKALESIQKVVEQNEDQLGLDFELIEAKALQRNEKVSEARAKYENIFKRYPEDPRAPLLLAEIYLNDEHLDKNEELLDKAEKIDPNHWLLELEKLIREYRLGNQIDISQIDEHRFPTNPRIKAIYYRIYSLFLDRANEDRKAESFIERAIKLNPDNFDGYKVGF
jgi:hypothetical protein